jgi:hypothetical protein
VLILLYDRSISISSVYCIVLCNDLNMSTVVESADSELRSQIRRFMEKNHNSAYVKPALLTHLFSGRTDKQRRSFVQWVMKKGDGYARCFLLRHCFPYMTDGERQSFAQWVMEKGESDEKQDLLIHGFPYLTDKEPLVQWAIKKGDDSVKRFLLRHCFPCLTNEEHRPFVQWAMEKGDDFDKRVLREYCFPYMTNGERRSFLVQWGMKQGDDYAKQLLSEDYFPHLTHEECPKVICWFLAKRSTSDKVPLLEACFSKSTPDRFTVIVKLIREPFLNLPLDSFCQVIDKADATLVFLFLDYYFSRWIIVDPLSSKQPLSSEQLRLLVRQANRADVLRLLEKYHHKLTDEQFSVMIKRADTIWAEVFLHKYSWELKIQRFSMVIFMCSLDGIFTLLCVCKLTFEQHQVIEERVGGLFEL